MQHLTDDLLLLARAEAGASTLRLASVDLGELLRDELARAVPPDRELRLTGEMPDVRIIGDAEQLRRVITNLVDNALRHAEHTVTVGLATVPLSGTAMVEVTVADDGPGIALADLEAVFAPFVRLDPHRARNHGGTGLGLSIAQRVVQAHHGTITVGGSGTGSRGDGDGGDGGGDRAGGAAFIVRIPLAHTADRPDHPGQL